MYSSGRKINKIPGFIKTGTVLISSFSILLTLFPCNSFCQVKADSMSIEKSIEIIPKTAMLRSAFMPGLGQKYNGEIFKSFLVFYGEMSLIGNAIYCNQLQVQSESIDEWEYYRNAKSRYLWWLLAVHLLNVIDAYVDASLLEFDVGPDLLYRETGLNFFAKVSICLKLN